MEEHYFTKKPTSPLRERKIKAILRNTEFEFTTAGGVFSPRKVDLGSQLLANKAIVGKGWKVLDLGCGYGVVGIGIKKVVDIELYMTDINRRAVKLAQKNAKDNGIKAKIMHGDKFEAVKDEKFDTILFNPPQTAGKKLCLEMIEESKSYLKAKGILQVVARHQKGGKEFERAMEDIFGNVETVAKKSGYRIYASKNA